MKIVSNSRKSIKCVGLARNVVGLYSCCVLFSLEQGIPVRAESERMDIHYLWCCGGRERII